MQQLRNGGPRPRALLTPEALRNAARAVTATAGSTNAVLHLLAIAHEAGVPFDLEEFEAASRAHAGDRRPEARRPLHRRGHVRSRRHGIGGARTARRPV